MPDPSPSVVPVKLSERSYRIEISHGQWATIAARLTQATDPTHVVVITDSNVGPLYADTLSEQIEALQCRVDKIVVPAGESSKSTAVLLNIWDDLLARQTDRTSVAVALGGGVIGDLAGFAAASYGRGIRLVQIPTTLLSQVDSSVGGKVGINLAAAKNMVGAFWQPSAVYIDTQSLDTLPDREFRSGLAEVVKYGVILDVEFFSWLEDNVSKILDRDPDALNHIVTRSCELKALVVCEDEKETTGRRAVLNYGHTYGHAIEALTGYGTYLHGEAISIGMIRASRLAESMGRIDAADTDRQSALLQQMGLPIEMPALDPGEMLASMQTDKKATHGKLRFVLPDRIGNAELVGSVDERLVIDSLK